MQFKEQFHYYEFILCVYFLQNKNIYWSSICDIWRLENPQMFIYKGLKKFLYFYKVEY